MSHRLISTQALAPAAFAWPPSTDDEVMGEPDEAMGEPDAAAAPHPHGVN